MQLPFKQVDRKIDDPVYIVGAGTSIGDFNFDRIRNKGTLIGCNKSAWWFDCHLLFSLDQHFVRMCKNEISWLIESGGEAWLSLPVNERSDKLVDGANYLIRESGKGISKDSRYTFGLNSGYAAINLAYLMGAKQIGLIGLDMQYGKYGETHIHDGYSWHNKNSHRWMCNIWYKAFRDMKSRVDEEGVKVINYVGSPASKIDALEKRPLSEL